MNPERLTIKPLAQPVVVLLIDDDAVVRIHLRLGLEKEGYCIVEAETGIEGLRLYSHFQPDIVLVDGVMPGMDGFECCAQLHALPGGDSTPILMITGLDDQESVDRAFGVGAADFVTKPVHFAVLRQRMRRLIQQSQLQQQLTATNKQLEAANRELLRLVLVDGLTDVANRRRFDEYLEQEWQRTLRERLPLSLILCDIDFFKTYNDTYGHQKGDCCLQKVAQAIQQAVQRPADLVARYGGEEFAILLPNTEVEGAVHVAKTVCEQVRGLAIPHANSPVGNVTLSAGVVGLQPHQPSTLEEFITAADRALYRAKALGRNRCCLNTLPTRYKQGQR
ncbi:PleD family two-component system response regulator [Phormidium tenue FACHB-886]|nr:PleD family two-component system response regulator [Phormidium tenue FACHB-886]